MIKDARKRIAWPLEMALRSSRRFNGVGSKFLLYKIVASCEVGLGFGLVSVSSLMAIEDNFAIKTGAEAMDSHSYL